MSSRGMSRFMGPLGLTILVAFGVGFSLGSGQPGENAKGAQVVSWVNAHVAQQWAQIYLVGLGLAVFLVYIVALRSRLARSDGASGALADLSFASGIVFVACMIVSGALLVMGTAAAANHHDSLAQTLNFFDQNDELLFAVPLAFFMLATGLGIVTKVGLANWVGWLAIVIGVVCVLGPFSFFGFLAGGVWLPIAGFVLGSRESSATTSEARVPTGVSIGS
ncbi:MAG: hypothetical protein ACRDVP_05055 [Acidimicrobiales bacterium]